MVQYTTVDRILAKINRDMKDVEINESDAIEWVGEALEFLQVYEVMGQYVVFIEVINHEADLPENLQKILQIAKKNDWVCGSKVCTVEPVEETPTPTGNCGSCQTVEYDCNGNIISAIEYKPYFNMQWQYPTWVNSHFYKNSFTPIRLSDRILFNSVVCKEDNYEDIYNSCKDEYTVVGSVNKKLRFSFKEGLVAVAFLKAVTDEETGYPLIPDDIRYITAITYYIKWKLAQIASWNGKEGFTRIADDNERLWLRYAKQSKNYMLMPKSLDEYINITRNTFRITNKYNIS